MPCFLSDKHGSERPAQQRMRRTGYARVVDAPQCCNHKPARVKVVPAELKPKPTGAVELMSARPPQRLAQRSSEPARHEYDARRLVLADTGMLCFCQSSGYYGPNENPFLHRGIVRFCDFAQWPRASHASFSCFYGGHSQLRACLTQMTAAAAAAAAAAGNFGHSPSPAEARRAVTTAQFVRRSRSVCPSR